MTMKKLIKKHDPLARKFLTDIEIAKDFVKLHLSDKIKAKCDFDTMRIESGSYIEPDLQVHFSDVVYSVNLKKCTSSAYIYVLIEHQSAPERFMPLRILRYQLAIIQKHLDNHKMAKKLPLVVPLVFYNGERSPYPYPCDTMELFADSELYYDVQLGKFKLVDLTVVENDEILRHGKLAVLEMLLKHIRARDFMQVIEVIVAALKIAHDLNINSSLVDGVFSYLIDGRETNELKQLLVQIEKDIPDYKEGIMTYAEELRREGEQRGEQRGIRLGEQRGEQRGEQKAQIEIAKQLLKSGVDKAIVAKATHLSLEQLKTLH
jgi:predicted transposase/invertase (TIGR01784 family)